MKLPKELRMKKNKTPTPNSKKERIKKDFPVHVITCECHNEPIPCPICEEIEFLRGWDDNGRTLAVCYFCGTVFYCDNDKIVTTFTDNPSRWAPRVIATCDVGKSYDFKNNQYKIPKNTLVITQDWLEKFLEGEFLVEELLEEDYIEGDLEAERRAKKEIKRRYKLCIPPIRLTLKRIVPTKEFQDVKEFLRLNGWKDWHLLLAIGNLVFNYRIVKLGIKKEQEKIDYIKGVMYLEEKKDTVEVPFAEFTVDNLYHYLYNSAFTTLKGYGYKVDSNMRLDEIRQLLDEINYWEYDVAHEPIFDL